MATNWPSPSECCIRAALTTARRVTWKYCAREREGIRARLCSTKAFRRYERERAAHLRRRHRCAGTVPQTEPEGQLPVRQLIAAVIGSERANPTLIPAGSEAHNVRIVMASARYSDPALYVWEKTLAGAGAGITLATGEHFEHSTRLIPDALFTIKRERSTKSTLASPDQSPPALGTTVLASSTKPQ